MSMCARVGSGVGWCVLIMILARYSNAYGLFLTELIFSWTSTVGFGYVHVSVSAPGRRCGHAPSCRRTGSVPKSQKKNKLKIVDVKVPKIIRVSGTAYWSRMRLELDQSLRVRATRIRLSAEERNQKPKTETRIGTGISPRLEQAEDQTRREDEDQRSEGKGKGDQWNPNCREKFDVGGRESVTHGRRTEVVQECYLVRAAGLDE
ncbi:hypothetical protein B0H13DRAFT_1870211 [Mycena leptocephala]|nr:hypothetical protein B0H13DRAFT_1870211 [Mycena leptocephala]